MNFVIKYIHSVWLAVLLGIVTTSCTQDSVNFVSADEARMLSIGFNVPTRSSVLGYEKGTDRENYIDWSEDKYRIYFFDINNKFIATFEPNSIESRSGSGNNSTEYEAVGEIPRELVKEGKLQSFKIVVLANWPAYYDDNNLKAGITTIDDICNDESAKFLCLTASDLKGGQWKVPFYGVQEYNDITYTVGQTTTLPNSVVLLRAMAKVEVILDTTIPPAESDPNADQWEDLTFSSVSICHYNANGYCAPTGVYSSTNYPDEQTDDKQPKLHLVGNANDNDNKSLDFFYQESESKWVAYLPEYSNQGQDDYSYITLKFNHQLAGDESYKIYFAQYQEGGNTPSKSDIDLIRNNIYRFTVKKDGFRLFLTVSDWEGLYENVFDFGDDQVVSPVAPWEDKINNEVEIEVN